MTTALPCIAALGAVVLAATPAVSFHVQSATDAAELLAEVEFLEQACGYEVKVANRDGLATLMRAYDMGAAYQARQHAVLDAAQTRGGAAVCAELQGLPGVAVTPAIDMAR